MKPRKKQPDRAVQQSDVPYTMRLPGDRTVFVSVPAKWCERDLGGDLLFTPPAIRLLDRIRVMAMAAPKAPSPGFIRTLREALNLTQARFGELLGVDSMTVSRWERGTVTPSAGAISNLEKLRREAGRRGVVLAA